MRGRDNETCSAVTFSGAAVVLAGSSECTVTSGGAEDETVEKAVRKTLRIASVGVTACKKGLRARTQHRIASLSTHVRGRHAKPIVLVRAESLACVLDAAQVSPIHELWNTLVSDKRR